jgi:BirA family biotin operon repressor/biotin-[acetyl-CoA-carboxylase] ligase
LAEKGKVAGILIENALSGNFMKHSVIGIGLNVNQEKFPKTIGTVTSLKNLSGREFDKDELLQQLLISIQSFVNLVERKEFKKLKELYLATLFKFNKPAMFEDNNGAVFLAKIVDIAEDGKLILALDNNSTREFNLKEIKFASC